MGSAYNPTLATFAACVACGIPQPLRHFPTKTTASTEEGVQVHEPRTTCAPCRTAIDTFLVHVDWRQGLYACEVCGGFQKPPFIPTQCTECGYEVRGRRRLKLPYSVYTFGKFRRKDGRIPLPALRRMYHRNYHVALMQRIVADIGIEDTTAVFNRYRPQAMLTCPCDVIFLSADLSKLRCSQTMDFWEIVAVLTGEL